MNDVIKSKFKSLWTSRKFWACLLAILGSIGAFAYGEISVWEMIQAVTASAIGYAMSVAVEDAGTKSA